jgi:hypothetical protein
MSEERQVVTGSMGDDAVIDQLLAIGTPSARALARLIATEIPESLRGWINAEHRAGTHPATITEVLAMFTAQIAGSVILGQLRSDIEPVAAARRLSDTFGTLTGNCLRDFLIGVPERRRQAAGGGDHRER